MKSEARRELSRPKERNICRLGWSVVCLFTIAIPLYISGAGEDVFRLPKELLFRLEAILLTVILVVAMITNSIRRSDWPHNLPLRIAIAATTAAAVIATAASTNRPLSLEALGYFSCGLVIFISIYMLVGVSRSAASVVAVGTAASIANALLAIMQRLGVWTPFHFEDYIDQRMRTTALLGNPNDAGAFLAVCAAAAGAYAACRPRSTTAWIIVATTTAGVLATDALTSIVALGATALALLYLMRDGRRIAGIALLIAAAAGCFIAVPSLRSRVRTAITTVKRHDYQTLTSQRFVPWNAALLMFRDRPWIGLGPGTFRWHYLPYRLRVERRHPDLYLKDVSNFREVHSDHLQILAEEGLVGYMVFLGNVGLLAAQSFRQRSGGDRSDERRSFARYAAFPLATATLFLTIAGFPLELSGVLTPLLFFGAVIARWSDGENPL